MQGLGGIVGLTVGVLTPLVSIYRYQPHPPPKRLIGKSPEYVEFYTHAYKAKTQLLRTKLAAVGAVTGCGLSDAWLFSKCSRMVKPKSNMLARANSLRHR